MNTFTIAEIKVGYWICQIIEVQSEANFEIVQRDFTAYKYDSMGKVISEHNQDLLELIEFCQLASGMNVYGYPELEAMARMAQEFWEKRRNK